MLEEYDIMLDNHHKDAKVTNIDIQMMVMAASTKKWQNFMEGKNYSQSKGVFEYEMCNTD